MQGIVSRRGSAEEQRNAERFDKYGLFGAPCGVVSGEGCLSLGEVRRNIGKIGEMATKVLDFSKYLLNFVLVVQ